MISWCTHRSSFRNAFSLSLDEKTLRSVVAHIAVCPKGCDRCMASRAKTIPDNDGLLPKEEAFLALGGWHVERQGRFCRESAEENHWKYDWDDFEDDRQGWIAFVSKQSDRPGEKATENLKSFWTGALHPLIPTTPFWCTLATALPYAGCCCCATFKISKKYLVTR